MSGENSYFNIFILTLGDRNPGAFEVIGKLLETNDEDSTLIFMKNLLCKNIVGTRLWYIYKHEANYDINMLVQLDLERFTDTYFYDKFEKYQVNV